MMLMLETSMTVPKVRSSGVSTSIVRVGKSPVSS